MSCNILLLFCFCFRNKVLLNERGTEEMLMSLWLTCIQTPTFFLRTPWNKCEARHTRSLLYYNLHRKLKISKYVYSVNFYLWKLILYVADHLHFVNMMNWHKSWLLILRLSYHPLMMKRLKMFIYKKFRTCLEQMLVNSNHHYIFRYFINLSLLLVSDTVYTRLSLKLELRNTSSNMKKSLKVKLLECEKYQQNFDSV